MKHLHYAATGGVGFGELFDRDAYARCTDPDTSHLAAEHVRKELATKLEYLTLTALRSHPEGLTTHELVDVTGLDRVTVSPRLAPLVRKGLAYDTGKRRNGPTKRPCIVWKAVEQ